MWLSVLGDLTGSLVEGNVYWYEDQLLSPNVIQYRRVGMWTPADAPVRGSPGKGTSSVSIDLHMSRTAAERPGLIQVLVFHAAYLPAVGVPGRTSSAPPTFCCTPELHQRGVAGCERIGSIVVAPSLKGSVWKHDLPFDANQTGSSVRTKVSVVRSGVHYLLLASCDLQTGGVLVSGHTTWLNPYGYLPGELYPFLPFFGALSLAYVALGVIWIVLCLRHCAQLLPLQSCISAVLFLGAVETATWYFDYVSFNAGGTRGVAPVVLGVLLSTVKKTVSRLLVLVVCLGYGVVRPTLGNVAYKVMGLGLVYVFFNALLDVASNVSQLSQLSVSARLLLILPMALLDAFFYWWLFSGLTRTLQQLSSRRQSAKLLLYRRFSHVLLAAVVVSALWVCWQMAVIVSDSLDERWDKLWVFDAFWHVLYLAVLLAICYLWSPSKNNLQYAYMDELGQEAEDDEEEVDMPESSHQSFKGP
eukprot:Transcript_26992.p1 GENE.Transcript_26992~~Transcript_26992.p1  ORF type:complete len:504 (-),score=210.75 Transcript_26992:59-1474(-)